MRKAFDMKDGDHDKKEGGRKSRLEAKEKKSDTQKDVQESGYEKGILNNKI